MIVADRASRTTGLPSIVAVALILIGPWNAAAFGAAVSTSDPERWPVPITCGGQVTPAGNPSALKCIGPVKPSYRKANRSNEWWPSARNTVTSGLWPLAGIATTRKSGRGGPTHMRYVTRGPY